MARKFPRRWVNAAAVLVQQRGVSARARQVEQSRETIYRDFRQVTGELEQGPLLREELQQRNQALAAEIAQLQQQAQQAKPNPFEDPDKVAQFAALAQAEGVSLPVAQRLLAILQGKPPRR
jgi:hypothetical protein